MATKTVNRNAKAAGAACRWKPNILVIWGDDIGISNLSCFSRGLNTFTIDDAISKMSDASGGG